MAKIDHTYHKLLGEVLSKGFSYEDPHRKGIKRIQIPHYTFTHDFKDGFPAITTKELYWRGVVGELLWILRGDTNIKYLEDNKIPIWRKDAYNYYLNNFKKDVPASYDVWLKALLYGDVGLGSLGKVYGHQLRNFGEEFDQLRWLLNTLKNNPMVTKKHVSFINPLDKGKQALSPCHVGFKILTEPIPETEYMDKWYRGVEEGDFRNDYPTKEDLDHYNIPQYKFSLQFELDSWDLFLGAPFNIASYGLLAYIIGKIVNMIPNKLICNATDVHIYEPHLEAVKKQLNNSVDTYNNCNLLIDSKVDTLISNYNKDSDLDSMVNNFNIENFKLDGYESYPKIPATMLAYNK